MVTAALNGTLESAEYRHDPRFNLDIPQSCPDVPDEIMNPRDTWEDAAAYDAQAEKLAEMFRDNFAKKISRYAGAYCIRRSKTSGRNGELKVIGTIGNAPIPSQFFIKFNDEICNNIFSCMVSFLYGVVRKMAVMIIFFCSVQYIFQYFKKLFSRL